MWGLFLRAWKLPNKLIREVAKAYDLADKHSWSDYELFATGAHTVALVEKARLVQTSETQWVDLHERFEALPIQSRSEIQASGDDIMAWADKKGGPWLKDLLARLDQAIIEGEIRNTQSEIKGWVKHVINESA